MYPDVFCPKIQVILTLKKYHITMSKEVMYYYDSDPDRTLKEI